MRRYVIAPVVLVLAALACSGLPGTPVPGAASPDAPVENDKTSVPPAGLLLDDLPSTGQLAVQGIDGNLYIIEQGKDPVALSGDATPFDENGRGLTYVHPTWSPQGWLSYVRQDTSGTGAAQVDLLAMPPGGDKPLNLWSEADGGYIYGYWSPAACSGGEDCGRFAYLVGGTNSIALRMAEVTTSAVTAEEIVGTASPFYFSWSPDGTEMLWHRNTTDLAIFDADQRRLGSRLPDSAGLFQSPAWSPLDDRWLFAVVEHEANQLTIADDTKRSSIGGPSSNAIFFNWSPDGAYIASAVGEFPITDLTLTRLDTEVATSVKGLDVIAGFFWSPDSSQLAVITVEHSSQNLPQAGLSTRRGRAVHQQDSGDLRLVWSVVDVATGEVTRLAEFLPTPEEFYMLRYFDQYAQSHRVWSPDSRYLVYAERPSADALPVISVLDTLAPANPPVRIMQGLQAIYSFGD